MVVVADASPLIFLSRLGLLKVLPQLFESITIPQAVLREVNRGGGILPGASEINKLRWLKVVDIESDVVLRQALTGDLGAGESEAIVLALESKADLLLVDDRSARAAARRLQLQIRGTLGILLDAKRAGLIEDLEPHLDRLVSIGAWLSPQLQQRVLSKAGE